MTRNGLIAIIVILVSPSHLFAEDLNLALRRQHETAPATGRYHTLTKTAAWKSEETALIVCDVWDYHHCLNAVRRLDEFAPRLNDVITEARRRGVTIIHSPSSCMPAYEKHPARHRAVKTPLASNLPDQIKDWCSQIPSEERGTYPIDQSDGGEDDDLKEHAEWAAKLKAMGRNPRSPWKAQSALITINPDKDYISDKGDEVWSILEDRGIKNVILTGVHTNMCVLGRPFGLRQMARNGKNVVLMRDMTDTMYNPQKWPYVSHFTGTDLIVSHIEKFVCATITSDQFIGGKPFRHKTDTRPHIAIMMAEDEYETNKTLPQFASKYLGKNYRVSYLYGDEEQRHNIHGLNVLNEADILLVSVRRRALPTASMQILKNFVTSGKPVVGIRTASHAFDIKKDPPKGLSVWVEFDKYVFGGNYHGHRGNTLTSTLSPSRDVKHPVLSHVGKSPFTTAGSLYMTSPLSSGATPFLYGEVEGHKPEPVAWSFTRSDGGKSFYTSLGHKGDFTNPRFVQLLLNGISWASGTPTKSLSELGKTAALSEKDLSERWVSISLPLTDNPVTGHALDTERQQFLTSYTGQAWYRCVVKIPDAWVNSRGLSFSYRGDSSGLTIWLNGQRLAHSQDGWLIPAQAVERDDANLLVLCNSKSTPLKAVPRLNSGDKTLELKGTWQARIGNDKSWSNMPLPAKFGASSDIVFIAR